MKPAPPVTRKRMRERSSPLAIALAVLPGPVVWNVALVRIRAHLVGLLVVVGVRRGVHEHRGLLADALHAMPHVVRNRDENRIALAHEELVDRSVRRRIRALVVEHD